MTLASPDERVIDAVHAAAEWFRTTAIYGYKYGFETGLEASPGAGPTWARMYEIGTNRPIFSNRDGVVRYDWNELTDRRTGYAWYGEEPRAVLERYERWAARHPRPLRREP
jgi:PelA/Pel-15E family pectate lyase